MGLITDIITRGAGKLMKKMSQPKGEKARPTDASKIGPPSAPTGSASGSEEFRSLKRGTRYVPKTGPYKLHRGEAVLTRKQAQKFRTKRSTKRSGGK